MAPDAAGRTARGRVPEHGAGDPRCGRRLPGRLRRHAGAGRRGGTRSAHNAVDRPGCRPADRGAERSPCPRDRGCRRRGVAGGRRSRRAGDHRRRACFPQSGRQRDVGAGRQRRGRGGLPSGADRIRASGGPGSAANQLPAGRRRRPVHDDRQDRAPCADCGRGSPRSSASRRAAAPWCTPRRRCR